MIDFRYHLVSIIAVFLALAVGIVLGNAALNDPVVNGLRGSVSNLAKDKRGLEGDVRVLQGRVQDDDAFTTSVAAELVRGTLTDQRVLIVSTPDAAPALADRMQPLLEQAGATVAGRVRLGNDLLDPAKSTQVADRVSRAEPGSPAVPVEAVAARAGAELAVTLVHRSGMPAPDSGAPQKLLAGFNGVDVLDLQQPAGGPRPATLAVVITGAPAQPPDALQRQRTAAVLAVAKALDDRSDGVVVAGPADAMLDGGVLRSLRDDSGLSQVLSSVDPVDAPVGQVLVALALREQRQGRAGAYGSGAKAAGAVPSPSGP